MTKILLKIINMEADPEAFRLHCKGRGIICINPNGIKQNELINNYIGEVYTPYGWYEKQDSIKKYLKEKQ